MSNRTKIKRRPVGHTSRSFPIVPVVIAVLAVVGIGVFVALAGGTSSDDETGDAPAFGPVAVEGASLPELSDGASDPATGMAAPQIEGTDFESEATTVGGGPGEPTMIVFLAHWCPHCQAEVPVIVDLARNGDLDGVRLIAVITGTNPDAPNFPPASWLDREEWPGEVIVDDEDSSAAAAYGLAGYPYIVTLDAAGTVVSRTSGEVPADGLIELAQAAQQAG